MELPDNEIWNRFRIGDEAAFEYLYTIYFDKLYNYGFQFTRNKELVEDSVQELFIELSRRRSFLSPVNNILPYLYSAYRRKIIRLRDKESKNVTLADQKTLHNFFMILSIEDEIVHKQIETEKLLRLRRGIEELPEKYREIIFYYFYENLSYEQIQEILGFENIKSVRNLLYKAIAMLKGC